jgi:hypothetical protein
MLPKNRGFNDLERMGGREREGGKERREGGSEAGRDRRRTKGHLITSQPNQWHL